MRQRVSPKVHGLHTLVSPSPVSQYLVGTWSVRAQRCPEVPKGLCTERSAPTGDVCVCVGGGLHGLGAHSTSRISLTTSNKGGQLIEIRIYEKFHRQNLPWCGSKNKPAPRGPYHLPPLRCFASMLRYATPRGLPSSLLFTRHIVHLRFVKFLLLLY